MTEAEWNACTDPRPMREFLIGKVSDRKLRLYAVACCGIVRELLTDERSRMSVDTAEQYSDGAIDRATLLSAGKAAFQVVHRANYLPAEYAARHSALARADWAAWRTEEAVKRALAESCPSLCNLLRDIFGTFFRPITIDPAWLAWNSGTVPALAQATYDDRAFDRMPILADALEDAGCHDADILAHCRGPGPHVRGCWVVDLLLEKA